MQEKNHTSILAQSLLLHFFFLRFHLNCRLLGLDDGDCALILRCWQGFLRSADHEHTVGREGRRHDVWVHVVGELVAPAELARDEAMLILTLLVVTLHDHKPVDHLHRELLGLELFHVQVDLEGIPLVGDVRHSALLLVADAPGPGVMGGQQGHHGHGVEERGRHQIIPQQGFAEVLVPQVSGRTQAAHLVQDEWE